MANQKVLLTGATGHIGFRTLLSCLEHGFTVRITSRSLKNAERVQQHELLRPYRNQLEVAEVKDMLEKDAFKTAMESIDLVIHLASPIPEGEALNGLPKETMVKPAVHGALNVLHAAHASGTVKRVVMASSVAVLTPKEPGKPLGPDDLAPIPDHEALAADDPWGGYAASKILAHDAATNFMKQTAPSFDLIRVLPSYVQGRNSLARTKEDVGKGSNDAMMDLILGKVDNPQPRYANTVLVDDVAEVFAGCLTAKIEGSEKNFLAAGSPSGRGIVWDDVTKIVEDVFPDAVKKGRLKPTGRQASLTVDYDVSETEKVFELKFKGLKEQVESVVSQYLELAK